MGRERPLVIEERWVKGVHGEHGLPNGQSSHLAILKYQGLIQNAGGIKNFVRDWCLPPFNPQTILKHRPQTTRIYYKVEDICRIR